MTACKYILSALLGTLLLSCATTRPPAGETDLLLWPAPPQPARIQWLKQVRTPDDYGIDKSFWAKVSEALSGVKDESIRKPYGVYADEQGRLCVVDTGSALVHIYDPQENSYSRLGFEEGIRFKTPIAVTGDDHGNLYITDAGTGNIFRYRFDDGSLDRFSPFRLQRPTGIAFSHRQQRLFVSDTTAHQIVAYDLSGQELYRIGRRGDGAVEFNYPTDLFVDRKGQLYVTDALNQRVQVLTPEGQLLGMFGEGGDTTGYFAKPKGVAVDSQGHIYVCDALLDAVQIFDGFGKLLFFFGGTGSGRGNFWMPTGIYIDSDDRIYVADSYNRRIQVFRYIDQQPSTTSRRGAE